MRPRVQIIDDNVPLTTLMAKALAKFGYKVFVENDPRTALESVRHHVPDLILLDVMMPGRDGGRLLLDLRRDFALRHIPVVLLTAIAREGRSLAEFGGIPSVVLSKPAQLKELLEVIDSQIQASRQRRPLQDLSTPAPAPVSPSPHPRMGELPDFDRDFHVGEPAPGRIVTPPPSAFSSPADPTPHGEDPGEVPDATSA